MIDVKAVTEPQQQVPNWEINKSNTTIVVVAMLNGYIFE